MNKSQTTCQEETHDREAGEGLFNRGWFGCPGTFFLPEVSVRSGSEAYSCPFVVNKKTAVAWVIRVCPCSSVVEKGLGADTKNPGDSARESSGRLNDWTYQ